MSVEQSGTTADGLPQYRRRWVADEPWCAMVLVHGINEHGGRYEHVGEILSAAGVDVLAPDNRGHGLSGGPRGHIESFDQFTADLVEPIARQREHGVPVALFGHSLGGLISTRYLQSAHPQPDIAALSGPALGAVVPTWQRKGAPILSKLVPRLRIPGEIEGSLLSNDPEVGAAFDADPLRVKATTANMGNEIFEAMAAANSEIGRIDLPLRIMHGEQDRVVPPSYSEILTDVPGSVRITYPGLQHEILNEAEHPQILADLITWMRENL
ncbi:MAG: lysophospholipase [Acidimicrobiales bacterium]